MCGMTIWVLQGSPYTPLVRDPRSFREVLGQSFREVLGQSFRFAKIGAQPQPPKVDKTQRKGGSAAPTLRFVDFFY